MSDSEENDEKHKSSEPSTDKEKDQDKSEKSEDKDKKESKGDSNSNEEKKPEGTPVYKKPAFIITVSIIVIVLIVGGIIYWLIARQYVSTDDAYVDGHVVQISPQIGAKVLQLHVADNQFVHKGDLLIELDTTDYDVALKQAQAQVASSEGRLTQSKAQAVSAETAVPESQAQQQSAKATLDNATRDKKRFENLEGPARSEQQLDAARTSEATARAQFAQAEARLASAGANVKTAEAGIKAAEGELQTSKANVTKAEVNLSYCKILAPIDGRVTERTVEAGNYVTLGQALFLLVDPNVWITANFKETQLTHLQPGQNATIKIDAFPGRKFSGHLDSIQAGSGSRFSVFPAENATGNYVKIVQRIPVKIIFDHDANTKNGAMLSPGLSVVPRVKVR